MPQNNKEESKEVLELEPPDDSIEEKIEEIPSQLPTNISQDQRDMIEDAVRANNIDIYTKKIETLLHTFPELNDIEQGDLSNEEYYNKLFRAASNKQLTHILKSGFYSINTGLEYYLTYFANIDIKGYADACKNDPNIRINMDKKHYSIRKHKP